MKKEDKLDVAPECLPDKTTKAIILAEYKHDRWTRNNHPNFEEQKKEALDFAGAVAILRDVVHARTVYMRLIWIITAIISMIVWSRECGTLLDTFIGGKTSTGIRIRTSSSIEFPLVTVCTYARVNKTKIESLKYIDEELLDYMLSIFKGSYIFYNNYNLRHRIEVLEHRYDTFLSQFFTNQSRFSEAYFFVRYGFDCKTFLRDCMFHGTQFDCCVAGNSRSQEMLSDAGKCFIVQTDNKQNIPGPQGGLKMYVNNWGDHYPKTMVNTNPDMGIQVHIIHPSMGVYISDSPINVLPNTHAMVTLSAIHRKFDESTKDETEKCAGNRTLRFFKTYSYEGCFTECIADLIIKTCGCVQIGTLPSRNLQEIEKLLCKPSQASVCVQPLLMASNMGFLWNMYNVKEHCDCPMACEQWAYGFAVSYSYVPNPSFKRAWKEGLMGNHSAILHEYSDDFSMLDIFFDRLGYEDFEQMELETLSNFIANVGGQMSIWLGIRLVTFIHVGYYSFWSITVLLPVLWHNFNHKQRVARLVASKSLVKILEAFGRRASQASLDIRRRWSRAEPPSSPPDSEETPPPAYHQISTQSLPSIKARAEQLSRRPTLQVTSTDGRSRMV